MLNFIGKKKGMTHLFDDNGCIVVCSVILAEPNTVVQKKEKKTDGYNAIQMGAFLAKKKRVSKPLSGHFAKANVEPFQNLVESRIENTAEYEIGQKIDASYFSVGEFVDISGVSKGKGYQGVIKLHGFSGGPAAHGSGFHRHAGSTGMRSTPGRCFPGGKRASRMGGDFMTIQNLKVVAIDPEKKLIVIKGPIPGSRGSIVYLTKAKKKLKPEKKK